MTQLNQIIAIEKGVKTKAARDFTDLHHLTQKAPLLSGIARAYKPKDDDGDQLPPESTRVQVRIEDVLKKVSSTLTRLFDVELTKDMANSAAKADVVVDGVTLLNDVPVTYLLFLEKQLVDLRTFVAKLPILDPAEEWTFDTASDVWATNPSGTTKGKKVPRNHVKAEATPQHPAQVEMWYEDVIVGNWTTRKFSGALPVERYQTLLQRVDDLTNAVKFAREKGNSTEVLNFQAGNTIFDYLFA